MQNQYPIHLQMGEKSRHCWKNISFLFHTKDIFNFKTNKFAVRYFHSRLLLFPTYRHILTHIQQMPFGNIVAKEEIAHDEQLLLTQKCFHHYTFNYWDVDYICLQVLKEVKKGRKYYCRYLVDNWKVTNLTIINRQICKTFPPQLTSNKWTQLFS